MKTRREFLKRTAAGGIAGIIASGAAPVYAKSRGAIKGFSMEQASAGRQKSLWPLHA